MDRVNTPPGGGRHVPFTATAHLVTGVALDPRFGIALDSILAAATRSCAAPHSKPSTIDGGLIPHTPHVWELPLDRCGDDDDWHWAATAGWLTGPHGEPAPTVPDVHRLHQSHSGTRAALTVPHLPTSIPRTRRRFRDRLTYQPVYPCTAITWHAVGDPARVAELVNQVWSIGARRGSGEGAVARWSITPADTDNPDRFAHTHPDGSQGRPLPARCIHTHNLPTGDPGTAGIRPPAFHPANQHPVMFPPSR